MDRFTYYNSSEAASEDILIQAGYICLYDGDQKTGYEIGTASLTTCRLIWADSSDPNVRLSLHHSLVTDVDRSNRGIMRSAKLIVSVLPTPKNQQGIGPVAASRHEKVKLSFRHGGDEDFFKRYREALARREWERPGSQSSIPSRSSRGIGGIAGVERQYQTQHSHSQAYINQAFEDLSQLMGIAGQMVSITKSITEKLRSKQQDISDDETVRFKTYLLSLGVSDPVTKSAYGSTAKFFEQLAGEIAKIVEQPLKDNGGMMTMPEVFCRVNRARGMELISTEDLLNASKALENLPSLPIQLTRFPSGVVVLELKSLSIENSVDSTVESVRTAGDLSAEQLSNIVGLSVVLCKERLLLAEKRGHLCRDDSIEGLRFFMNKFIECQ